MRLTAITLLLAAVTITAGCSEAGELTCTEHHSVTVLVGYHDRITTTSDGRMLTVTEPITTQTDICDHWEIVK